MLAKGAILTKYISRDSFTASTGSSMFGFFIFVQTSRAQHIGLVPDKVHLRKPFMSESAIFHGFGMKKLIHADSVRGVEGPVRNVYIWDDCHSWGYQEG
jgi:hypothetical protein